MRRGRPKVPAPVTGPEADGDMGIGSYDTTEKPIGKFAKKKTAFGAKAKHGGKNAQNGPSLPPTSPKGGLKRGR